MPLYCIDIQYGAEKPQRISNYAPNDATARTTGLAIAASFGGDVKRLEEEGAIVVQVSDEETGRLIVTIRVVCSIL